MNLMPVSEALARVLDGRTGLPGEDVPVLEAVGRVLSNDVVARRTQPPHDVSAMDGYAVRAADCPAIPAQLKVQGESAAGHPFTGTLAPGAAVRIFTGAMVPDGADTVVMQEDCERDGTSVSVGRAPVPGQHIRRRGLDFRDGTVALSAGHRLTARDAALAAAMDHATLRVHRRPRVAILSTGDELHPPGSSAPADAVISSNNVLLAALARAEGADVTDFGIIPDAMDQTCAALQRARDEGFDVIVTSGGASVGDHDLVHRALTQQGAVLNVWKIAMRPGKPFMLADLGAARVLGLPGNPVSSFVCALLFLRPLLRRLAGRNDLALATESAVLSGTLRANDQREDYVRATLEPAGNGWHVIPAPIQDSSMQSVLAAADALIVRPAFDPARTSGETVTIVRL